jgi:LuxR family maltose regulon positive regulatory protein
VPDGRVTGTGQPASAFPSDAPLEAPFPRNGLIVRGDLLRRLAAVADDVPLVLLTAPAGYGKTTVLSQWMAAGDRDCAWVTVDAGDNDPVRLAGRIADALHRIEPLDPAVFRALAGGVGSRHLVALPHLFASLRGWTRPAVLVLDDVHALHIAEAMNFVRALGAGLPPGFHLAIGSRLELSLGRLRLEGRCVEFGRDDLAFTAKEAAAVLSGVGVAGAEETVDSVVRRTEGWPAGVYLAALALRTAPDAAAAADRIAGDDPLILDYFLDQILARESPDTVRFMLRTAALDEMCGSLCDHVLEGGGSAGRLGDAARRSLFVVPLDRRGEWYRYHTLVADMLRSELRRREPGEELRVHRRAAGWYEERGDHEAAITHALASQDTVTAAQLMNRHAQSFIAAGRLRTVRGWLDALDEPGLTTYPPLAITAAWIFALDGDPLRAQRCLRAAERLSFEDPMPDGSVSFDSARTVLHAALGASGVERMAIDATAAVDLEPPGSTWYPVAMAMLGTAHALTGAPEKAVKELTMATRLGRDVQRVSASTALAELSLLAADRGDWATAEQEANDAVDLIGIGGLQDGLLSILAYVAAARVAAHQGDHDRAQRYVGLALRLYATPSPAAFPWVAAQVAITLGQTCLDLGDGTGARVRVEDARRHLAQLPTDGVLRQQLRRVAVRLPREASQPDLPSATALTAAELRVLQLLATHLAVGEIGDELHTSRNTAKTHVAAIYRKLQCSTRTAAVHRGRALGVLGP